MIIGARRAEEAKVFDSDAGYHRFHTEDDEAFGSFEIFWHDAGEADPEFASHNYEGLKAGWYWWSCQPGCFPDGEPNGPFGSSTAARRDADEFWDMEI